MKKNNNISVVIINDFDYIQGGASKVAIDTANLLAENNYDVYFFSGCHNESSNINSKVKNVCTNQGEALRDKNKIRGFINGIYNFKAKKELKKILEKLDRNNTIIHIHGWTKSLSSSVFDIAFKQNFKIVLTAHDYFTACPNGGYFNYKKNKICHLKPMSGKCIKCNCDSRNYFFKMYRLIRQFVQNKIVKFNDRLTDIITISDFSEKILKNTLNNKVSIHKIYNPIDFDKKNNKINYKKNDYYLYVGRISKEKGVNIFCEAITSLSLKGIVVGDGTEKQQLSEIYKNIEFVGWKNNEEVKKYMQGARALIMPSKWYECAPLTPLEALQYGIPSFVSSNCAASDITNKNNRTGDVFELDVESLKKCIVEYSESNIDTNVLNSFTHDNYLKSLNKLYADIVREVK